MKVFRGKNNITLNVETVGPTLYLLSSDGYDPQCVELDLDTAEEIAFHILDEVKRAKDAW